MALQSSVPFERSPSFKRNDRTWAQLSPVQCSDLCEIHYHRILETLVVLTILKAFFLSKTGRVCKNLAFVVICCFSRFCACGICLYSALACLTLIMCVVQWKLCHLTSMFLNPHLINKYSNDCYFAFLLLVISLLFVFSCMMCLADFVIANVLPV